MSFEVRQTNKQCITCVFWSGQREVKYLIKRVVFIGCYGTCIQRKSPKFNTNQTWDASCPYYASILK